LHSGAQNHKADEKIKSHFVAFGNFVTSFLILTAIFHKQTQTDTKDEYTCKSRGCCCSEDGLILDSEVRKLESMIGVSAVGDGKTRCTHESHKAPKIEQNSNSDSSAKCK